jgi:hypothetical protein
MSINVISLSDLKRTLADLTDSPIRLEEMSWFRAFMTDDSCPNKIKHHIGSNDKKERSRVVGLVTIQRQIY